MANFTVFVPNNVFPEPHEMRTARILKRQGDVMFLKPTNQPGRKTPDIFWLGQFWELKSPKGKGRWTIEREIHMAVAQSPNIVMDLSRTKAHQNNCLARIRHEDTNNRRVKRLKIVTKEGKIIDIK